MNEFVIEWTRISGYAGVTTLSGSALKSKLIRYAKERPEEVQLIRENQDGSAFFHVPVSYVKVSPPREVSEEQRQATSERSKRMWEEKRNSEKEEDLVDGK